MLKVIFGDGEEVVIDTQGIGISDLISGLAIVSKYYPDCKVEGELALKDVDPTQMEDNDEVYLNAWGWRVKENDLIFTLA